MSQNILFEDFPHRRSVRFFDLKFVFARNFPNAHQFKNSLPMLVSCIPGMDHAAKLTTFGYKQMLTFTVLPFFSAGRAPRDIA